uniref:DUF1279 domain-containing protein n=1 Tax=Glossina brevipalpis TaxID=37001 RepID=A0A1A9WXH8_9MUSC
MFSSLRNIPVHCLNKIQQSVDKGFVISSLNASFYRAYITAVDPVPLPLNIDAAESTRFSPQRGREISAIVTLTQQHLEIPQSLVDITTDNTQNNEKVNEDPHLESYDCFGPLSLYSAMQSNVPTPFTGMQKYSHLNMPGGQWSQECKITSQNLQSSHYTALRNNTRCNWSNCITQNTVKASVWFDMRKCNYCTEPQVLSKKEQLKKAFKEYGSTIVAFHVVISLISLGGFYLLVTSGIDIVGQLQRFEFFSSSLTNKSVIGASNFMIAYAVHKIFAPVRISMTLASAPFIVRFMRSKGYIKN